MKDVHISEFYAPEQRLKENAVLVLVNVSEQEFGQLLYLANDFFENYEKSLNIVPCGISHGKNAEVHLLVRDKSSLEELERHNSFMLGWLRARKLLSGF